MLHSALTLETSCFQVKTDGSRDTQTKCEQGPVIHDQISIQFANPLVQSGFKG